MLRNNGAINAGKARLGLGDDGSRRHSTSDPGGRFGCFGEGLCFSAVVVLLTGIIHLPGSGLDWCIHFVPSVGYNDELNYQESSGYMIEPVLGFFSRLKCDITFEKIEHEI